MRVRNKELRNRRRRKEKAVKGIIKEAIAEARGGKPRATKASAPKSAATPKPAAKKATAVEAEKPKKATKPKKEAAE